jgi:hypothetical protein
MRHLLVGVLALWLSVATPSAARAAEPKSGKIRIIDCDAHIRSHRRGVCVNELGPDDFRAIAPGVSWYYNWYFEPGDSTPPAGVDMEFLPMLWGLAPELLAGFERYLAAGHKPRAVLAINEPNLRGQAFITPAETAALYKKAKAVADRHGIPVVVGPHMALGSAPGDSITARDPIEDEDVTYTFMVPFLKAFLHHLDPKDVGATAFHSYGNLGEMRWAVGLMHKEFGGRPTWVTEYNLTDPPTEAAAIEYLVRATDFLERTPHVHGYAWFKERADGHPHISLFEREPGKLSALGRAYVALPSHDADVYYRLPGRLAAAKYVALDGMEISPATDGNGFTMGSEQPGGWLDYNVHVERPGAYQVRLRVA